MAAQVYFADMRAGMRENLHTKLERLTDQAGMAGIDQQRRPRRHQDALW